MSTHVLSDNVPDRDRSVDRFLGFVESALPTSVGLRPETTETASAPTVAVADRPDWWTDGTLPGIMAGKRPAL